MVAQKLRTQKLRTVDEFDVSASASQPTRSQRPDLVNQPPNYELRSRRGH
jgi:hypothetical protein